MGHVQEGDAQALLHGFQFKLHFLAQLQVQRAQGLVQEQHLGLVHQRPGDGDTLLLAAGEGVHPALAVALQVHQVQHIIHLAVDFILGHLFQLQAEGDVVPHVQVRKQRVLLKHGIHPALVGRDAGNILAVENHAAGIRRFKPADDAQGGGFPTAGRAQQGDELLFADVQVNMIQHRRAVILLVDVLQGNQALFFHVREPP